MDRVDSMKKAKIIRFICGILIVIFGLGFIFSMIWYQSGSFEMMPTGEQQEKVQLAAILLMIVNGVLVGSCVAVHRVCKIIVQNRSK